MPRRLLVAAACVALARVASAQPKDGGGGGRPKEGEDEDEEWEDDKEEEEESGYGGKGGGGKAGGSGGGGACVFKPRTAFANYGVNAGECFQCPLDERDPTKLARLCRELCVRDRECLARVPGREAKRVPRFIERRRGLAVTATFDASRRRSPIHRTSPRPRGLEHLRPRSMTFDDDRGAAPAQV